MLRTATFIHVSLAVRVAVLRAVFQRALFTCFPLCQFDVFMLIAYLISIQIDINHIKIAHNIYVS